MPELRKDPVVGRWIIIATERARRPGNLVDSSDNTFDDSIECHFCNNQEPALLTINNEQDPSKWQVKVVESGTPILRNEECCDRQGKGLYDIANGYGAHEVVIETPEHIANMADLDVGQIKLVLDAYVSRMNSLAQNQNLQYILAYKNYGWMSGGRKIGHSRSQILATPVNTLRVKEKLSGAKKYFEYKDRCIYCDLVREEIEQKKRLILESDNFIAVTPFASRFIFEINIFPKEHHCDFAKGVIGHEEELADFLKKVLLKIKIGLNDPAYNYIIQTAPLRRGKGGPDRWKTIQEDYHWHIEIMPRITRIAGFEKGTGFYISCIPPEASAEYLRGVEI